MVVIHFFPHTHNTCKQGWVPWTNTISYGSASVHGCQVFQVGKGQKYTHQGPDTQNCCKLQHCKFYNVVTYNSFEYPGPGEYTFGLFPLEKPGTHVRKRYHNL